MNFELVQALKSCISHLPEVFYKENKDLFKNELIEKLSNKIIFFHNKGAPENFPPPHLSVEYTPKLKDVFVFFKEFMDAWTKTENKNSPDILKQLANSITNTGCKNILVILGQRLTPASLTDYRAIPPLTEVLMKATEEIYSSKLNVGARALTKHVNRNAGQYWPKIEGNDAQKNAMARNVILGILQKATWWNVFGHYKHDIVFEARIAQGYGARWSKSKVEFIGFLEPFTDDFQERLS